MEIPLRTPRTHMLLGVRDQLPNVMGIMPFGMVAGAFTASVIKNDLLSILFGGAVFAGRAQLVAMQLITENAPFLVIIFASVLINARHILYGAALSEYLKNLSMPRKMLYGFLMTDMSYVIGTPYLKKAVNTSNEPFAHWYFFGSAIMNWSVWTLGCVLGVLIGSQIPPSWSLDFVPPLTFITSLVGAMRDRASIACGVVSGVTAVALADLPWALGLFIGVVLGLAVGMWIGPSKPKVKG
jgi:4-azaleucine resistance transporter AzlC